MWHETGPGFSTGDVSLARLSAMPGDPPFAALQEFGRELTGVTRIVVLDLPGAAASPEAAPNDVTDTSRAHAALDAASAAVSWLARPDLVSIAVARGDLAGWPLHVALACDLRIMADASTLSVGEPATGRLPLPGVMRSLVAALGYARALELALTGRRIAARDALALGLATIMVPATQLEAAADDLVAALLLTPREVATEIKMLAAQWSAALGSSHDGERARAEVAASLRLVSGPP